MSLWFVNLNSFLKIVLIYNWSHSEGHFQIISSNALQTSQVSPRQTYRWHLLVRRYPWKKTLRAKTLWDSPTKQQSATGPSSPHSRLPRHIRKHLLMVNKELQGTVNPRIGSLSPQIHQQYTFPQPNLTAPDEPMHWIHLTPPMAQ